ncbi:class I SAM-dependent methyltransferase [Kaustia mangrovi]|nr:class I SAM-dependent methyltransferase [Kaustia mangrovi]
MTVETELPIAARGTPSDTMEAIALAFDGLAGRTLLDIGCGRGALAGALRRRGARVAGVDPNPEAVEAARRAVPEATFEVSPGETLPFPDGAFDGAVFLNSLHHVASAAMAPALGEAARVTGPGRIVLVVEPLAAGPSFEVMRPIDDETEIRARAERAISAMVAHGVFSLEALWEYDTVERVESAEAFLDTIVGIDPSRADTARREAETVAALLEAHGTPDGGGYLLAEPLRAHVLRVSAR